MLLPCPLLYLQLFPNEGAIPVVSEVTVTTGLNVSISHFVLEAELQLFTQSCQTCPEPSMTVKAAPVIHSDWVAAGTLTPHFTWGLGVIYEIHKFQVEPRLKPELSVSHFYTFFLFLQVYKTFNPEQSIITALLIRMDHHFLTYSICQPKWSLDWSSPKRWPTTVTELAAITPAGYWMARHPESFSSNSALVLYYKLCSSATFLVNVPRPSPAFLTSPTF